MNSLTFDTLRDRNEASLKRIGYLPDRDIGALNKYRREQLFELLARRQAIEEVASTQSQREAYEIEQWHEDFVRLHSINQVPDCDLQGEQLRKHVWRAVPNARFKRFQQIFSHPHQFIVPPFTVINRYNVVFRGHPDFNAMSLQPCLVSADRISDALATDLKLVEFEKEDRPLDRLKRKAKPEVVARLKKLWESTVHLQKGNHRVLAIQKPDDTVESRYPNVASPHPEIVGTLLYVRELQGNHSTDSSVVGAPRQLMVQHFPSVYATYRKTFHEFREQKREMEELTTLRLQLLTLNRMLNTEWKDPKRRPVLLEEAQTVCDTCTTLLQACVNKHKLQAFELTTTVGALTDSRGKQNVSASMAKMIGAINRLEERFNEMYPIGGFNEQDQAVIHLNILEHEHLLQRFRQQLVVGAHLLDDDSYVLFNGEPLTQEETGDHSNRLITEMGIRRVDLQQACLQPFVHFASRLTEKCGQFESAVQNRDRSAAQNALLEMHIIGKFQGVRHCFEHIKAKIVNREDIFIIQIRSFVESMEQYFSTIHIFPDVIVAEYEQPFEDMKQALGLIKQGLTHYAKDDIDVSRRTTIYKNLKTYLETFDIEEIVDRLP